MVAAYFGSGDERTALPERQRVSHHCPQHRDHRHHGERLHHRPQDVLLAHQAAIKQRQTRPAHQQNQRRARQHPRVIARRLRRGNRRRLVRRALLQRRQPIRRRCRSCGPRRLRHGHTPRDPHRRYQHNGTKQHTYPIESSHQSVTLRQVPEKIDPSQNSPIFFSVRLLYTRYPPSPTSIHRPGLRPGTDPVPRNAR
jgi:hypothetical protein